MSAFRLLFSRRVVDSIDSLDHELKSYFHESTSFRSSIRKGTIIIIDRATDLFDFLGDLIKNCQLKFRILHIADPGNARKIIEEVGSNNIKAVVINSLLLSENGATLSQWLNANHPEVPVWISDCPPDKDEAIRKNSQRVGILRKRESFIEYIDVLGFPSRCHDHVSEKSQTA